MKRQVYLAMKPLETAREILFSRVGRDCHTAAETINTVDALARVTAEPVFAVLSAPSYHSSAMDGIAVKAEGTYGATERHPIVLAAEKDFVWVNTGQPLPEGFDAVIMVENLHQPERGRVEIRAAAHPWQNVRKVGEDIVATQLLYPQHHRIRAYDIGALISAGVASLKVRKRPVVAILPTGSELVRLNDPAADTPDRPFRIIEYNSQVLRGLVLESGGIPVVHDIVPDHEDTIRRALRKALDAGPHVIIINAGSSSGSKDYTVHVIREMGEVLVHGVAMMPGKPTILGYVEGIPVIGNPGYAVSAVLSFEQFVRPLIYMLQAVQAPAPKIVRVFPTQDIPSRLGVEEFLRVSIGKVQGKYTATPLSRSAGAITTLTRAEGILRIPALSEGIARDEEVSAELLVDEKELENAVVVIGSHDIAIDILADEMRRNGFNIRVVSANVGSLGGLMAQKKGTCHVSGAHLLDTETSEYNLSYIRKYLKGVPVSVFHLVLRDQGLIVQKGNPRKIKEIKDLARPGITFVNRQPGSGTRILLDYKLRQQGIAAEDIAGYDHVEYSHMSVAVDVLSRAADCGMGIHAAARALGLDFVPVEKEQYDLIIRSAILDQPNIRAVLDTIRTDHFRKRVAALGGYDPKRSGELRQTGTGLM